MKQLKELCRILVALVFIFSGFVKVIDPVGTTIKFVDYFNAFHLTFLTDLAFYFAILLNIAELMIGIGLFLKLRMNLTAWTLMIFMSFFTLLTLILAIFNPVSDCGCFGDALVLTNWETFYKNVIIIVLSVVVFVNRKNFKTMFPNDIQWIWVGLSFLIGLYITIHSYKHLPVLDFRPYKVGVNITEAMSVPEDAPLDKYETTLIYEKNGKEKEFKLSNYPANDSTWKFVRQESVLVEKGYEAPIHDFSFLDKSHYDYSSEILSDPGYTFVIVSKAINKINKNHIKKAKELNTFSIENNINLVWLTSSSFDAIDKFKQQHEIYSNFYNGDETTIKTIIRSNPGLLLLKEGTIIEKWHFNDVPEIEELNKNLLSYILSEKENLRGRQFVVILVFLFFAIVLSFKQFLKQRLNS